MVSKLEIRKNRVDLLYHQQLQKLNALLIFATTGVLSFVGGILVVPKAFLFGIGIGTMILLASALYYKFDLKVKMSEILKELDALEKEAKK